MTNPTTSICYIVPFIVNIRCCELQVVPAALELLAKEGDISVIISDQRMPMMSGTEFLSLTATQYPDIIRIILTGYTDVEDLVEAINAGKVFKYVTKPWEAEELKAVVRQALDTHNVLRARTYELTRTLRQESLLNSLTNTIRGALDYRQILQAIVDNVGHMLEVNVCLLRPFQNGHLVNEGFIFQKNLEEELSNEVKEVKEVKDKGELVESNVLTSSTQLLAHTVWETREVMVISDATTDERVQGDTAEQSNRAQVYEDGQICSSLVVPLICQQELMAVLALHQSGEFRDWEEDDVQLVVMVANQAALALSQARAYEQVHALAQREALINTITSAIRSSLDPQEIFAAITEQLGQALQVDGCVLSLWTAEDEFVECVGLYDSSSVEVGSNSNSNGIKPSPHQLPQSLAPLTGNQILQKILQTQEPVIITDLKDYSAQVKGFDLPFKMATRSLMVVPLLTDGKIIGSISLRQSKKERYWLKPEVELAASVAVQAALAVQQSRLYQKTRQQAERLLELDKQKTEFFQNISHEFRTPITLIQGPLESAVSTGEGLSHEQSTIALRNSRRLLRLVNQLLDLQRLDAGRMQPSFRKCDLVEFVSQIVESFRPYCEKKDLNLVTELDECPAVYLDMEKFDKVVYNLLSNAMKFTPQNGSITIRLQYTGSDCVLQVEDTGIGIAKEQIPHLFERFRQAEGSENRSYEGTGLGLALVKELVEVHGGTVTVDSIYESGTNFTISLPSGSAHLNSSQVVEAESKVNVSRAAVELADLELIESTDSHIGNFEIPQELLSASVNSPEEKVVNSKAEKGQLILVVDDNPDMRAYVSSILRANGYQVQTARNGSEGFHIAKELLPNLIVTDLMMPLITGLEMIRMIRSEETLKGIPIILLTAKVDEDTRIEGTERGADAYLAKPFNDRELLAEARNLLALKENERKVLELNTYLTESVLQRFLPPVLVQKAQQGELVLDLRPEPRLITVLFSDIVGFTQLSNTLRSRKVAELLNEYLEAMTKAVFDNGGTVDKFMGDAILALYGAPEELTPNEQVRRAVNTSRAMLRGLSELNERWRSQGIFDSDGRDGLQFRCGIHQGTAVVGMFGSSERADYTAIGPSVNIASRLQGAADPGTILVSAAVADYLEEEEIIKGKSLELKGIDETVLTFAVTPEIVVRSLE